MMNNFNYDLDLAKKLTIVIPLKGRPAFTLRMLLYMEAVQCPFKVLFADGGINDENYKIIEENKYRFPHVDFEYHRFPPDHSILDFDKKMVDALNMVQTPYYKGCANDDFPIINTIFKCINFLEQDKNNEYVGCGGTTYRLKGAIDRLSFVKLSNINGEFLQEKPIDRILQQIPYRGMNIQHGVLRAKKDHKAWAATYDLKIKSSDVYEFFYTRMLLAQGKYKHIAEPILIWNKGKTSWSMQDCKGDPLELQRSWQYLFEFLGIQNIAFHKNFISSIRDKSFILNSTKNYPSFFKPFLKIKYAIENAILYILPKFIKQKLLQFKFRNNHEILFFIDIINQLVRDNSDFYYD